MRHVLLASITSLALFAGTMAAEAVDVVNEDDKAHEIMLDNGGDVMVIEVLPGESLKGVCERCTLSIEDGDSIKLEGDQFAVIKSGKLQLRAKVN